MFGAPWANRTPAFGFEARRSSSELRGHSGGPGNGDTEACEASVLSPAQTISTYG